VLVVFLNKALDTGDRQDCGPAPTVASVCMDVTVDRLTAPDDEAHRHPAILQLQEAEPAFVQPTTLSIVLDDSSAPMPRRTVAGFINPAVVATMTMLRGSSLPVGFTFVAPGVAAPSTTATL